MQKISEESYSRRVFLIFFRHVGCILNVHMGTVVSKILDTEQDAKVYCFFPGTEKDLPSLEQYLPRSQKVCLVPDPEKIYYKRFSIGSSSVFGLVRGGLSMLRLLPSSIKQLPKIKFSGDPFQLPGFVLVEHGKFTPYKAKHISDLPKINQLLCIQPAND